METLTVRHPKQEDAQTVCELVLACDVEDFGQPDFTLEDLLDMWAEFDLENNVWVVENGSGTLVGYAFLEVDSDEKLSSYGYVLPSARGTGVGTKLLDAIEERAAQLVRDRNQACRLQNVIPTLRDDARLLLSGRGFQPVRYFKRMSIQLNDAPPIPMIPQGFTINNFVLNREEQDVYDAYVDAFTDHWDFTPPPFEEWVKRTRRSGFSPDWWFTARDESGRIAGIALGRMHDDTLFIDQIGVRRPYRGQGLGLALLQQAFGASFAYGQSTVSLGVDSENPSGAVRLYEKAGMQPTFEVTVCEKQIG